MSLGVTGVNIAPELGLHFHDGSLSFFERLCCCGSKSPADLPELNEEMYITSKYKVKRWQDVKGDKCMSLSFARLQMVMIERLEPFSDSPYEDAKKAMEGCGIEWSKPRMICRQDLQCLDSKIKQVRESLLNMPLGV